MNTKEEQSAVEWLIIKDSQATVDFIEGKINSLELAVKKATFIQQAKEMEKEQIELAFKEGQDYQYKYQINNAPKFDWSIYYDKTHGGDK
jgi:hypothetical protein